MDLLVASPVPVNEGTAGPPCFWRISVERYHGMIEAGVLTENDRLELLEGFLIEKMTVNPPHAFVTETLRELLAELIPEAFFVSSQQPVTTQDSEPEPDVSIVQGDRRDFVKRHPGPADLALVVEVADATLHQDQTWKKRIYAGVEIPIYWIVNLPDRQIEVYTQPAASLSTPTYNQLTTYRETDEIPLVLGGEEIARFPVSQLLP